MELVVHIGTYKTGSSYLQRFVKSQFGGFERLGVHIPTMGRDTKRRSPFHNLAHELLHSRTFRPEHGTMASLREELLEMGPPKVLISSEVLSTALLGHHGEASRAAFHDLADSLDARLRYVVYVRDQVEVMNSTYCQNIKQLMVANSFDEWAVEAMDFPRFSYGEFLEPLLDDPDVDMAVFNYAEAQEAGLLATLLSVFGLDADATEEFVDVDARDNTRPGPATIAVGRSVSYLCRSDPSFAWNQPRYKRLSRLLMRHSRRLDLDNSGFWGWSEAGAAACTEAFSARNDALAQRVWNRPWPSTPKAREQNTMALEDALAAFDQRAKADLFGVLAETTLRNEG